MIRRPFAAAGGAVAAALGSALCCAGPLVAVALGVSGAGLTSTFEPARPYFVGATVFALAIGHWSLRKEERNACEPGKPCADPRTRRMMRWTVWLATVFAAVLATFPYWSRLVL
ncbi:MAG: mercuric transporter MerT family protein [Gemmatimonadota bacterium]